MEPLDLPKNPYTVKVYSCPSSMFDFKTALSILFAIRFNNSKCDTPQLRDSEAAFAPKSQVRRQERKSCLFENSLLPNIANTAEQPRRPVLAMKCRNREKNNP